MPPLSLEDLLDPQILQASPRQTLADIASLLDAQPIASVCILVIDNQQLRGILTSQNFTQIVTHSLTTGVSLANLPVSEVMTPEVLTLSIEEFSGVQAILQLFQEYNLQYLPVLDSQGQPQGVISQTRLLQALTREQSQPPLSVSPTEQLEQEVRRRTTKLAKRIKRKRLLSKIALRIHESLDLKTILTTTIAEVRNFLDCDRVLIYRLEPNGGGIISFEAVSSAEYSLNGLYLQDECFECEHSSAYQQGHYRAIKDVYTAGLSPCHLELLENLQIRANLVLPLLNNGELWGLLSAQHCQSPKAWQPRDIDFLQELVIQVEIAIQQANLVNNLETEVQARQQTQSALSQLNEQLEQQVAQRTQALRLSNQQLREEVIQSQQIRQELQEKLNAIEATRDGIAILKEGKFTYLNRAHGEIFGYEKASELIGQSWDILYEPEKLQALKQTVFPILQQTGHWQGETVAKRKDGSTFPEELSLSFTLAGTLICICRDITHRVQIEETIKKNQYFIQHIADTTPSILYILDIAIKEIIYINDFVNESLGYAPGLFQNAGLKFIKEIIHPDDRERVQRYFHQLHALDEQEVYEVEYRLKSTTGHWYWFRSRDTPFARSEDGTLVRILGTATEITKQKQIEAELYNAFKKEREINVLKSRLVMMTSHEFRTPLTTILGTVELLKYYREKLDQAKEEKYFNRIESCVKNMIHLLDDILLLGRTEEQKLMLNPVKVDLVQFCHKVVAEHNRPFHPRIRVFLQTKYQELWGIIDCKNLYSVLNNLLSNALKYSDKNDIVELEITVKDNSLVFSVKDRGIGIPAHDLDHIFEYFYRASNVDPNIGTGLGLAIAKNSVQLTGGEIWVQSELDVGTTFTVSIPTKLIKVQETS